jgi:hypothetical protein
MTVKSGYTEDEVALIHDLHSKGLDIEHIAQAVNKTVHSVRSKLVRDGVYIKQEKKSAKKTGPGKKELVRDLEKLTGIQFTALTGANKEDLVSLKQFIESNIGHST